MAGRARCTTGLRGGASDDADNRKAQLEEIESVEAIYGDLIHLESPTRLSVHFTNDVQLIINLPEQYPSWFGFLFLYH
ncbi:unnamed protein product [Gongylonema pulchrum]|uniref:RWD domain-containing protein n=1 Tax=Gongylonema pulchrum TaxID=637853 RepID=A0A183ELG3_9BILA|nr:unnamed protein product [Gongylonema pulchrum]